MTMLRALWFLLQVLILAGLVAWFARYPGQVTMDWRGYVVQTSVGVLLALFGILLFCMLRLADLARFFMRAFAYRKQYQWENGLRGLTAGFLAIAAGDGQTALFYARKVQKKLPHTPLIGLLQAQAYRLTGQNADAQRAFKALADNKETAFFGVKGALQEALRQGRETDALTQARKAHALYPRQPWIVRARFALEVRQKQWEQAYQVLKVGRKQGLFSAQQVRRHRQAMALAQAESALEKGDRLQARKQAAAAFALGADFTPAALMLIMLEKENGHTKAAHKVIQRAFAACPHPALAAAWTASMPISGLVHDPYSAGREKYAWVRKLYRLQPQHRESKRIMGLAALEAHRWAEARALLLEAEDYRSLARLEKQETGLSAAVQNWLDKAAQAPPDPTWICQECQHRAETWRAFCSSCGEWNTMDWRSVEAGAAVAPATLLKVKNDLLDIS